MADNLVEGSEYEFRVYAQNSVGISASSELSKTLVCKSSIGQSNRKSSQDSS